MRGRPECLDLEAVRGGCSFRRRLGGRRLVLGRRFQLEGVMRKPWCLLAFLVCDSCVACGIALNKYNVIWWVG